MALLFTRALVLPMTDEKEPHPFTGTVGVAGNRLALVADDKTPDAVQKIAAFRHAHPDLKEIDAAGKVLMPGLINTHCHVSMTLLRGYADDLPLMTWLQDYVWPFEGRMTPDDMVLGAELGMAEMLLAGTTSFVDMYWHENRIAEAVGRLGIRALLGASVLDANWDAFEEDLQKLLPIAAANPRIRAAVAPHAPYTCSPETLQKSKELARRHGLPFMIHVSETEDEVRMIQERYGTTSTQHLDTLGVLDEQTIAAHCVYLTDEDIRILKARGTTVSHNAQSNLKLASGIAPVAKLLREGVCCTLGTDGAASNNDLDMWEELRTASLVQKAATKDPLVLPAYEALKMATVNAARALGHAGELGIIKEGALADFILLDTTNKPHLTPTFHLAANLAYCAKASDVDTVVVDGELLVEGRKIKHLDLPALCEKVQATALALR